MTGANISATSLRHSSAPPSITGNVLTLTWPIPDNCATHTSLGKRNGLTAVDTTNWTPLSAESTSEPSHRATIRSGSVVWNNPGNGNQRRSFIRNYCPCSITSVTTDSSVTLNLVYKLSFQRVELELYKVRCKPCYRSAEKHASQDQLHIQQSVALHRLSVKIRSRYNNQFSAYAPDVYFLPKKMELAISHLLHSTERVNRSLAFEVYYNTVMSPCIMNQLTAKHTCIPKMLIPIHISIEAAAVLYRSIQHAANSSEFT
jgi:hypothetical protein